jgi:hypothetical protein
LRRRLSARVRQERAESVPRGSGGTGSSGGFGPGVGGIGCGGGVGSGIGSVIVGEIPRGTREETGHRWKSALAAPNDVGAPGSLEPAIPTRDTRGAVSAVRAPAPPGFCSEKRKAPEGRGSLSLQRDKRDWRPSHSSQLGAYSPTAVLTKRAGDHTGRRVKAERAIAEEARRRQASQDGNNLQRSDGDARSHAAIRGCGAICPAATKPPEAEAPQFFMT